jgi:hypothetical protein
LDKLNKMSEATKQGYENVLVTDSRLLQRKLIRSKLEGAKDILYKQWPANAASSTGISFDCPTPNEGLEIDRQIMIVCPVEHTFTMENVPAGLYILNPDLCAVRSYPLQKGSSRVDVTLNTKTLTINLGEVLSALENFNTSIILKNLEYSTTSTYGSGQSQAFDNLYQGSRSELSIYINSLSGVAPQSFPFTIVSQTTPVGPGPGTATSVVQYVTTEPLFISPCYWGNADQNDQAFIGIDRINVNIALQTNCGNRMFAINNINAAYPLGAGPITTTTRFSFSATDEFAYADRVPKLLIQYINPEVRLPKGYISEYPYYQIDNYVTIGDDMAPGDIAVVASGEFTLPRLPTKIFVYARQPDSVMSATPFNPDCFMAIQAVNLRWNNRFVLNGAHQTQLYQIAVKNGVQMDYTSWSGLGINTALNASAGFGLAANQYGGTGSICCFDPLDLGLTPDMSQYPERQVSFQINVTLKNIAAGIQTPALYIVTLTDGVLRIVDGIVTTHLGVIDTVLKHPIQTTGAYFSTGSSANVPNSTKQLASVRKRGYMGGGSGYEPISFKNLFKRRTDANPNLR